jgi:hypothetical protein
MWLSLDLSSRTGWAVWYGHELQDFGLIEEIIPEFKSNIRSFRDFPSQYPENYIVSIERILLRVEEILAKYPISLIVTEHTEGSSFRFSQKYLEWLHLAFWQKFSKNYKIKYLLNKDWRQETNCYLKRWPEFDQHNKLYAKIKKKTKTRVIKHEGKRIGRMDQKKLSIHIANILLKKLEKQTIKDDNIADAINIGQAAIAVFSEIIQQRVV